MAQGMSGALDDCLNRDGLRVAVDVSGMVRSSTFQVGIRTLRCEAAPTPTVAALRTAPRRRDLAAYGRLWRTPCYRFSFMNAAGLP
jgi:hypothetical protein